jgi:hypothetical protein
MGVLRGTAHGFKLNMRQEIETGQFAPFSYKYKTMRLPRLAAFFLGAIAVQAVETAPLPDFATQDWNTDSLRRKVTAEDLSPRNYLNQVTAWYFGHET